MKTINFQFFIYVFILISAFALSSFQQQKPANSPVNISKKGIYQLNKIQVIHTEKNAHKSEKIQLIFFDTKNHTSRRYLLQRKLSYSSPAADYLISRKKQFTKVEAAFV